MNEMRAYVQDGIVLEILTPHSDFTFEERFAPDFVANCVPCGTDVLPGWTYTDGVFAPPEPPPAPPEPTPEEQDAEARAYVLGQLGALDAEYLTPRTLAGIAAGEEYALESYRLHEEKAEIWRCRLEAIPEAKAAESGTEATS
jgi:hypothetical protein